MKTLLIGATLAATGWTIAALLLGGPSGAPLKALAAFLIVLACTAAMFLVACLAIIAGEFLRIRRARRTAARPAPGIRGVIEGGRK